MLTSSKKEFCLSHTACMPQPACLPFWPPIDGQPQLSVCLAERHMLQRIFLPAAGKLLALNTSDPSTPNLNPQSYGA
jgi:hypothetical protein